MNQFQAIEGISKALGVLTHQIEQENLSGLFSKNRIIEDIFLPVFQVLFSAPGLRNLNSTGSNHAHLDLADNTARLGIQVSTDRSAAKVTKTLKGVLDDGLTKDYDRVVIFMLSAKRSLFTKASKMGWSALCGTKLDFDPDRDIVELPSLLSRISGLPYSDILTIQNSIAHSIVGNDYVDVLELVSKVSEKHLSYEKKSARYIPGVFIETRDTKQLCRCFCHPAHFLQRSVESGRRLNLSSWNDFLERGGLELLPISPLTDVANGSNLIQLEQKAETLWASYQSLLTTIKEYEFDRSRCLPLPTSTAKQLAFYEENAHALTNELQFLPSTIRNVREEFEAASKRIFLLTGTAGQGKTNLLCDLYENFLVKHGIPCAFLSGRELGLKANGDLAQVLCAHLFGTNVATLDEGAARLSKEALRCNKPFVLMIDGLNEHREIGLFSQQLEYVVDSLLAYPGIRFLFSCRTEFFDDRFSNLTAGTLKPYVILCKSSDTRLADAEREELVSVYFEYFEVNGTRVASHVQESLTKDLLLLRFFCETYGRRGKDANYEQPDIRHFYRDELFKGYVSQKLQTANIFLQSLISTAAPTSTGRQLEQVLHLCLQHMLSSKQFLGVPLSAIPSGLQQALYSLLDEELIIRKDVYAEGGSAFSESVNFTFDELRDYLLAQFLIGQVYPAGLANFLDSIEAFTPQSAPTEGVQRFLFYASRKSSNTQFYKDYRQHPWYVGVYHREVFNVDQANLGPEDAAEIKTYLQKLDWKANEIARNLAVRWDPTVWPVLSLAILNTFVFGSGVGAYRALIMSFSQNGYRQESLSQGFYSFVKNVIMHRTVRAEFHRYREIVKLLMLMAPLEGDSWWTGPALECLRGLLPLATGKVTEELLGFPLEKFPEHRRMIWRLLYESMSLKIEARILARAEADYLAFAPNDYGLTMELKRFLEQFREVAR